MGEPAGIGGELTVRAWLERTPATPVFAALDDPDRLAGIAARLGLDLPVATIADIAEADSAFVDALPVLPCPLDGVPPPGRPDSAYAAAVIGSIRRAADLAIAGAAAAIVTNPIQKHVLAKAGFQHPGHTEFLGEVAGVTAPPVMMLAVEGLRVAPVTIHTSLAKVPDLLTTELIVHTARTVAEGLITRFGIAAPRLAVAALNPHAGENGLMGDEEDRIIRPAVDALAAEGLDITGPHPADTLFHAAARQTYDAAVCMYHDQALVPLKTLDFYGGVNITLGLPFIRTSPDHGTALDIAGSGTANPASFIAALKVAGDMAARASAPRPAS